MKIQNWIRNHFGSCHASMSAPGHYHPALIRRVLVPAVLGICMLVSRSRAGEFAVQRLATFSYSDDETQPTSLIRGSDGNLYGTTSGDHSTNGTVFRLKPDGELTVLASFDSGGTNGCCPGALVQAPDGSFYGATGFRSGLNSGRVFHLTPGGEVTTIFSFDDATGDSARVLLLGADGNLYGTTSRGGTSGYGTIFKLTLAGEHAVLFSFSRTNGINPTSLVRSGDGTLFGTTSDWIGVNAPDTVFRLSPSAEFTILSSSFTGGPLRPWSILLGRDGKLYGVDRAGGSNHFGTIFSITPAGTITTLAEFDGTNGWDPDRLIEGADGNLYGTSAAGGVDSVGWVPSGDGFVGSGSGAVFRVTPDGELVRLASLLEMPGNDVVGFVEIAEGVFGGARTSGEPAQPAGVFRVAPAPTITGLKLLDGLDVLSWSSFHGGAYRVEYRATCAAAWNSLPSPTVATGNQASWTNSTHASSERYYRVRLLP